MPKKIEQRKGSRRKTPTVWKPNETPPRGRRRANYDRRAGRPFREIVSQLMDLPATIRRLFIEASTLHNTFDSRLKHVEAGLDAALKRLGQEGLINVDAHPRVGMAIGGPEWRKSGEDPTPESVISDVLGGVEGGTINDLEERVRRRVNDMISISDAALQVAIIEAFHRDSWIGLYPLKLNATSVPWPRLREQLAANTLYIEAQRRLLAIGRRIGPKA